MTASQARTVALKLYSPLVHTGLVKILGSIPAVRTVNIDGSLSSLALSGVDLIIIDAIDADCIELIRSYCDAPVIGVFTSHIPPSRSVGFAERIDIYESEVSIVEKIRSLLAGGHKDKDADGSPARTDDLSPREKDVILGIVKGFSNKEIAAEMNVSVNTVMTHRRNIASKLQIHSVAGLTIYAITTGLVDIADISNSDYI